MFWSIWRHRKYLWVWVYISFLWKCMPSLKGKCLAFSFLTWSIHPLRWLPCSRIHSGALLVSHLWASVWQNKIGSVCGWRPRGKYSGALVLEGQPMKHPNGSLGFSGLVSECEPVLIIIHTCICGRERHCYFKAGLWLSGGTLAGHAQAMSSVPSTTKKVIAYNTVPFERLQIYNL